MILETERLLLRPPIEADLEAILELHSLPRTNLHNPAGPTRSGTTMHYSIRLAGQRYWDAYRIASRRLGKR